MLFGMPKQSEKREFQRPAEGEYYGVVSQLVYVGAHMLENKYGKKIKERIYIRLELNSFMKDENGNEIKDKPFIISENLTFSYYGQSQLKEIVKKFGHNVDDNGKINGEYFDIGQIVGKTIKLSLEDTEYNGKMYQNATYSKNFNNTQLNIIGNNGEPLIFYWDEYNFDIDTFQKLPEFLRKKIIESENVKNNDRLKNALSIQSTPEENNNSSSDVPVDEDAPF